jgi:hypothetical protein
MNCGGSGEPIPTIVLPLHEVYGKIKIRLWENKNKIMAKWINFYVNFSSYHQCSKIKNMASTLLWHVRIKICNYANKI